MNYLLCFLITFSCGICSQCSLRAQAKYVSPRDNLELQLNGPTQWKLRANAVAAGNEELQERNFMQQAIEFGRQAEQVELLDNCKKSEDGLTVECHKNSLLGEGMCNFHVFEAILAAARSTKPDTCDVVGAAIQRMTPLYFMKPPSPKEFSPAGFEWQFPGLYEIDPRGLYIIEDFVAPEELLHMNNVIDHTAESVMGWSYAADRDFASKFCSFGHSEHRDVTRVRTTDHVFAEVYNRILKLTGKSDDNVEDWFSHAYQPGGYLADHLDVRPCELDEITDPQGSALKVKAPCHDDRRQITVLTFLNDIAAESGGGTYFPHLGVRVQPKAGQTLVFFPTYLDKSTNPFLVHSGETTKVPRQILQMWLQH